MPLEDHVINVFEKETIWTDQQHSNQTSTRKNYEDNVVGISSQPLSRCLLRESALEKNNELD